MELSITGKHIDLGDAFQEYIKESVLKVTTKYFDHALEGHVTVEKAGQIIKTLIEVHVGKGILVVTNAEDYEAYASLDLAIQKMEHRLARYHDRLTEHHRHHDHSKDLAKKYILEGEKETQDPEDLNPTIIAETTAYIPTLSVSEAVMRMDLADIASLLFRNKSHGGLNMVYLRKDSNIGWIDPQGNAKES